MVQTLLLTFVSGLLATLQAQAAPALHDEVGTWYLKAMVADKEVPGKKVEAVGPITLTVLEGGNLEFKGAMLLNGQCEEQKLVLEETNEPGKFTAYGGKRLVFIEKTHVKDHYILYCEGEFQGQQVRMAKLVGRDSGSNQRALEEFKAFTEDRGFHMEISLLKQTVRPGVGSWRTPESMGVDSELAEVEVRLYAHPRAHDQSPCAGTYRARGTDTHSLPEAGQAPCALATAMGLAVLGTVSLK
ncbi:lipocalin-1, partial [Orycteropus afer afer]|uniref:Lipocalin-1 n=1 Tax=Orycteropus afer afer TaxID=1230840 RepID=A0A8B7BB97_ORYAF